MANQMLTASLGLDAKAFERGINRLDGPMRKLGSGFSKMALGATAAFAALSIPIVKAVQHAAEFEFQMARVKAITVPTAEGFRDMRKAALEMSTQFGRSAPETAQGLIYLGQAGFSAKESVKALPAAFDLAAIAGVDLATSADTVAVALRTFNIDASEASKIASVFAYTQSTANTNVTDMAYALKFAGPIMSALGISIQETSAAIGVLADSGIRGSLAGTSLRGAFSKLMKPTGDAKAVIRALGIELKDHEGKMKGIAGVIEEFERLQLNETEILQLVGVRAAPAFLSLMNGQKEVNGEILRGSRLLKAYTKDIEGNTDYAKEAAATIRNTLYGAWDKLNASIGKAAITFTEKFRGPLNQFIVGPMKKLIEGFDAWLQRNTTLEKDFGAFFKTLTQMSKDVQGTFSALAPGIETVMTKTFGLTKGLPQITGTIRKFAEEIGPKLPEIIDKAFTKAGEFMTTVKDGWLIINDMTVAWRSVHDIVEDISFVLGLAEIGISATINGIAKAIKGAGELAGKIYGAFENFEFPDIWKTLTGGAVGAVKAVNDVFNSDFVGTAGNIAESWAENFYEGMKTKGKSYLLRAGSFIASYFQGHSPPEKGPLSMIDVGAANVAKAWGKSFLDELAKQGGAAEAMASRIQRGLSLVDAGKLTMGGEGEGTLAGFVGDFRLDKEQWMETFDSLAERSTEFADNFDLRMQSMILGFQTTGQIWSETAFQAIGHIQEGFDSTLNAMIFGGQTIGAVWKATFKSIVKSAITNFAKMRMQALLTALFTSKAKKAEAMSVSAANTEIAATGAAAFAARLGPAAAKAAYSTTKATLTTAYTSALAMTGIAGFAITGAGGPGGGEAGGGGIAGQGHDGISSVPTTGTYLLKQGEMVANPTEANALRSLVDAVESAKTGGGPMLGAPQVTEMRVTIDFSNLPEGTNVDDRFAEAIIAKASELVESGQAALVASRAFEADNVIGLT